MQDALNTERLLLRPAYPSDLHDLHAIFSDPRAMRYWDRPAYNDVSLTQRYLDWFLTADPDHREEYILQHKGRAIGKAGVWAKPEIGYILHPDFWGQGLAREAMAMLIPRAFAKWPDMSELTAEVDPRNAASKKLLSHFGFQQTDLKLGNFLYGQEEWCDTAYFALQRDDLLK